MEQGEPSRATTFLPFSTDPIPKTHSVGVAWGGLAAVPAEEDVLGVGWTDAEIATAGITEHIGDVEIGLGYAGIDLEEKASFFLACGAVWEAATLDPTRPTHEFVAVEIAVFFNERFLNFE
jgi:hypothetical protein